MIIIGTRRDDGSEREPLDIIAELRQAEDDPDLETRIVKGQTPGVAVEDAVAVRYLSRIYTTSGKPRGA